VERKVFASSVLVIMRVMFGPTLLRLLLSVKATLSANDDESSYFAEFFYGSHLSKHHKFLSSTDRHNLDQALHGVNAGLLEHFGKRNEHLELVASPYLKIFVLRVMTSMRNYRIFFLVTSQCDIKTI
jgi:hypothetical protein